MKIFAFIASLLLPLSVLAGPQMLLPYEGPVEKSAAAPKEFKSEGARVRFNIEALRSLRPGEEVELSLPNGRKYTFITDQYQVQGVGVSSWIGYLDGGKEKLRAIITTGPGGSYGRIATPDGDFRLVPGPGHDWLVDMVAEQPHLPIIDLRNDTRVPPPTPKIRLPQLHDPEFVTPVPGVNTLASVSKATPATVVVDLMVVYTNGLLANLGATNLNTRINNLVTAANTAYADSEVGIVLRLVHTTMVTYPDSNGDDVALDEITPAFGGPTATFSGIEGLRTTYGADMVAFLRNGPSSGGSGIAWIANAPISSGFAPYMYSVTTGCTALCDFVFIHELGHNMGNAHDRATSAWQNAGVPEPGSYAYSFGYYSCQGGALALSCAAFSGACVSQPECSTPRSGTNNFADIMAYFHGTTVRNMKFSNPNLSCQGAIGIAQACGVAQGQPQAADAAASMNNNRTALSALRPTVVPVTPPAATSTALASLTNPSTAGVATTFRATVTSASGTPAGTVLFTRNGVAITGCETVALSGGIANCSTSALAAGTHTIAAQYAGSATHAASASTPITQTVNPPLANATITLTTSQTPADEGLPVTYTARFSGSAGVPTGNAAFYYGTSIIPACGSIPIDAGGVAACTSSSVPAGNHQVWVRYSPSAAYNAADSTTIPQTILAVLPGPKNYGLASAGATATASSNHSAGLSAPAAINGDRAGVNWGNNSGWNDGTAGVWPDWLEVAFTAPRNIDRVVVYTLQDAWNAPSEPTDTMTFTQYGIQDFTVQGWNGSAWVTLASVTGNNLVKRTLNFTAFSTDRIRIHVTRSLSMWTHITEVEAWAGTGTPGASVNVAAAAAGAAASASSNHSAGLSAAAAINGDRAGANWGNGSGWNDGTAGAWPDWLQVAFAGSRTIDRVVVYTLQDAYATPSEPTDSMTFTQYGIQDFTVQGWNGSAWVTLATVTNNNLVKRTVNFTAFATDRIRVNVTRSLGLWSHITEVEAWTTGSGGTPPPASTNLALASSGATATASSNHSAGLSAAAAINGDRAGMSWGNNSGWNDGTAGVWPDWLQVNFAGSGTIDRVVVYTLQDAYATPSEPTDSMTFTQYGIQDFSVQGWNGSAWVTLATVTNNNLVKRTVNFTAFATDRIRVNVTRSLGLWSHITEVEAWTSTGSTPPPAASNVALASAGASATASSVHSAGLPAAAATNGDRAGLNWGAGSGWNDGTAGVWPDWLQVNFAGSRSIDRVVVYTLQDAYATPSEPTDSMTFTSYGIQDFTVEGWNGSAWVVLGTVTGNNLVKRTVTFTAFSTDRIRINVTRSLGLWSHITEVEAWGS